MHTKMLSVFVAILVSGQPAFSEGCSEAPFRGKSLKFAREAYHQAMNPLAPLKFSREQIVELRSKERTCDGQSSYDYILLMTDVRRGTLQQGVDALASLLQADLEPFEKSRLMNNLIDRFVRANEIRPAISLIRSAMEMFPEYEESYSKDLILLLAGTGQFEEARKLADRLLEEAMQEPSADRIPYAGWLRLSVSEVSGDSSDHQKVIARLSEYYGDETEATIEKDALFSTYSMLLSRRFDPDAQLLPIKPPRPQYPLRMAQLRKSGICDVRFDVGRDGVPSNITAECSDDGFAEESVRAVSTLRFKPPILSGVPQATYNVIYPLEYIMN